MKRDSGRRHFFFWLVRRYVPEGCILPKWLLAVRMVILPLDTFFWHMQKTRGYDLLTDTWNIYGVRYSSLAMSQLANADGETYLVWRRGDTVSLQRVVQTGHTVTVERARDAQ